MQKRRRFKQTKPFQQRLSEFIAGARSSTTLRRAARIRPSCSKKIRQAETAADIEKWVNSPELQTPK
jgi:hypothetical protein